MSAQNIEKILGAHAKDLLEHVVQSIRKESLHVPGPDFIDRVFAPRIEIRACCAAFLPCITPGGSAAQATFLSCL
jgi:hypothetical protein